MAVNWRFAPWETPFQDTFSLRMEYLLDRHDEGMGAALELMLQAWSEEKGFRYRVIFHRCAAYRNVSETYWTKLWEAPVLPLSPDRTPSPYRPYGWTFIVQDSPWIAELNADCGALLALNPGLVHYAICTEDDNVEALTQYPPIIEALGEVPAGERPAGKAEIFYK
jgi:hypothetical protein